MAGLNHDFHLLDLNNFSHDFAPNDYLRAFKLTPDVSIHDDTLHYMYDSITWIQCYNPARREVHDGLCFYGPTVIRKEGAEAARQVFQSWANLFSLGPAILNLHIYGDVRAEPRDELVSKLTTLAGYAQKIIDTNAQYFILHLGI